MSLPDSRAGGHGCQRETPLSPLDGNRGEGGPALLHCIYYTDAFTAQAASSEIIEKKEILGQEALIPTKSGLRANFLLPAEAHSLSEVVTFVGGEELALKQITKQMLYAKPESGETQATANETLLLSVPSFQFPAV